AKTVRHAKAERSANSRSRSANENHSAIVRAPLASASPSVNASLSATAPNRLARSPSASAKPSAARTVPHMDANDSQASPMQVSRKTIHRAAIHAQPEKNGKADSRKTIPRAETVRPNPSAQKSLSVAANHSAAKSHSENHPASLLQNASRRASVQPRRGHAARSLLVRVR